MRTIKQERYILENYLDYTNRQLAEKLGMHEDAVRATYQSKGLRKTDKPRFRKGNKPWNTGTKGKMKVNVGCFKKGNLPINTVSIGSTRYSKDGIKEIKYKEHKWRSLHTHIWILAHGEIPKGSIVVFKDGADRENPTLNDLELITRAENMLRNSRHRLKQAA